MRWTLPPAYLATVSGDGTTLLHSTYYGGAAVSSLRGLAQGPDVNFWITGDANSADLPMPAGSLNLGGSYLAELDPSLSHVLRYYGVPRFAIAQTVNILPSGELVLTGGANSLVTMANGPTQPFVWAVGGAAEPGTTPHIAAGELISLYGVQLGPNPGAGGSVDASGKLGTGIAGYTVLVNGIPAPLLYAGPNANPVIGARCVSGLITWIAASVPLYMTGVNAYPTNQITQVAYLNGDATSGGCPSPTLARNRLPVFPN